MGKMNIASLFHSDLDKDGNMFLFTRIEDGYLVSIYNSKTRKFMDTVTNPETLIALRDALNEEIELLNRS